MEQRHRKLQCDEYTPCRGHGRDATAQLVCCDAITKVTLSIQLQTWGQ